MEEKTGLGNTIQLEDQEFVRLSNFIMSQFGIKLPPNKKTLLQCRLQRRLKILNYNSFRQYVDYVFSSQGLREEVSNMIDAVSTNKTDFFREPLHFEFLNEQGISGIINKTGKSKLSIWSAGCSSGEEPYTLAMVMKEFSAAGQFIDFNILATDISDSVLQHAIVGIYTEEKTRTIPYDLKKKYLLKGKNAYSNKVRIIPELRSKIDFRKFNLLTTDYSAMGKFDIIFCRNVMIYFEREVQFRLLKQFCKSLNDGGYLFLGHSESITGYTLPLQHIQPTIFMKTKAVGDRKTRA
jgi:chemotaxis protein methyltransferase CheR